MHLYRVTVIFLTMFIVEMPFGECGPARSIALVAQRSPKIPISIRAPFKHSETMVARGYGKRAFLKSNSILTDISGEGDKDKDGIREYLLPRGFGKRLSLNHPTNGDYQNYGKKEMNFLDEGSSSSDGGNDTTEQISNDPNQIDGVPIEWVANELTANPGLLRAILYRFVDVNKDGFLTSQEFLGSSSTDSNNISY